MTMQLWLESTGGGAVSIGNEREEDQEPHPDGEELAEDEDEADEERDPDPAGDEAEERRR